MHKLTLERPKGKGWRISQGKKFADQLTLGEILEQIIHLHYHGETRYPLETVKQQRDRRNRWRKSGKRIDAAIKKTPTHQTKEK